jgi:hypothetical protein
MNGDSILHDFVLNKVNNFPQEYLILELNNLPNNQITIQFLKKVLHKPFSYQIPENSGFPLSKNNQGKPRFLFADANELNQAEIHSFLLKILTALKLDPEKDLQIIACEPQLVYPVFPQLIHENADVISFGITPMQLKLQGFDEIHFLYHYQQCCLLFANSLSSYTTNDASKKLLWAALKKMFELN